MLSGSFFLPVSIPKFLYKKFSCDLGRSVGLLKLPIFMFFKSRMENKYIEIYRNKENFAKKNLFSHILIVRGKFLGF
jgi:hypothetical protein